MNSSGDVELKKALNPSSIWALAVGSIIGFGCFILPPDFLEAAGPLGLTIGLIAGAATMLIVGVNISKMVKVYPFAGGQFTYAYKEFGSRHAYICGWMLYLCYVSLISMNATALGVLGQYLFPGFFERGYMYTVAGWNVYLPQIILSLFFIVIFGVFNLRGGEIAGKLQLVMVLLMIIAVLMILIGTLASPVTSVSNLMPLYAPGKAPWKGVLYILALAPWLYVGFDTIPQSAEEFRFSTKKTLLLVASAIICGALMYITVSLCTAMVWPWRELVEARYVWATGEAMQNSIGTAGVVFLAVAICMGIFTGMNGFYLAGSRLMFSMAREQVFPVWFAKLHNTYRTPHYTIIAAMLISIIAPFFGRTAIGWVVDMCSCGTAIGYFYTCTAGYKVAVRTGDLLGKTMGLTGVLLSFGILLLLIIPFSPGAMGKESWLALTIWVLLGILFYCRRKL